eukprot:CAMPEP_0176016930 /NCGR_PEP_ID=MMETSP0120_2-20121206/8103_1 /TAXON_ID=160619 /ORGANISM="Kryptoperidinium foliaceum, Strain CCMP 1326" /LENGTH=110 /DNA_ID=CAMNT_0017349939 /DNA_START=1039 /DNA_END=1369 /DNA_ORIENTATION=+
MHEPERADGKILQDEDQECHTEEQRGKEGVLDSAHHANEGLCAFPRQPKRHDLQAQGGQQRADDVTAQSVPSTSHIFEQAQTSLHDVGMTRSMAASAASMVTPAQTKGSR